MNCKLFKEKTKPLSLLYVFETFILLAGWYLNMYYVNIRKVTTFNYCYVSLLSVHTTQMVHGTIDILTKVKCQYLPLGSYIDCSIYVPLVEIFRQSYNKDQTVTMECKSKFVFNKKQIIQICAQ